MSNNKQPITHIQNLKRLIDMICEDPIACQTYTDNPKHKLITIDRALCDLILKIDFNGDQNTGPLAIEERRDQIMEILNSRYQYYLGGGDSSVRVKPIFTYQLQKNYIP